MTVAPLNGAVFAGYKFLVKVQLEDSNVQPTLTQVTLAGIGCGIVASYVPYFFIRHYELTQSVIALSPRRWNFLRFSNNVPLRPKVDMRPPLLTSRELSSARPVFPGSSAASPPP